MQVAYLLHELLAAGHGAVRPNVDKASQQRLSRFAATTCAGQLHFKAAARMTARRDKRAVPRRPTALLAIRLQQVGVAQAQLHNAQCWQLARFACTSTQCAGIVTEQGDSVAVAMCTPRRPYNADGGHESHRA